MSDFEPSKDFVQRVVTEINEYERQREIVVPKKSFSIQQTMARFVLPIGSVFFGIWNMLRLYYSLFAPALSF